MCFDANRACVCVCVLACMDTHTAFLCVCIYVCYKPCQQRAVLPIIHWELWLYPESICALCDRSLPLTLSHRHKITFINYLKLLSYKWLLKFFNLRFKSRPSLSSQQRDLQVADDKQTETILVFYLTHLHLLYSYKNTLLFVSLFIPKCLRFTYAITTFKIHYSE